MRTLVMEGGICSVWPPSGPQKTNSFPTTLSIFAYIATAAMLLGGGFVSFANIAKLANLVNFNAMKDFLNVEFPNLSCSAQGTDMKEATLQELFDTFKRVYHESGLSPELFAQKYGLVARTVRRMLDDEMKSPGYETMKTMMEKIGYGLVVYKKG